MATADVDKAACPMKPCLARMIEKAENPQEQKQTTATNNNAIDDNDDDNINNQQFRFYATRHMTPSVPLGGTAPPTRHFIRAIAPKLRFSSAIADKKKRETQAKKQNKEKNEKKKKGGGGGGQISALISRTPRLLARVWPSP